MLRSVSIDSPKIVPAAGQSTNPSLLDLGRQFDEQYATYWTTRRNFRVLRTQWEKLWEECWPNEIRMRESDRAMIVAAEIYNPSSQQVGQRMDMVILDELEDEANLQNMSKAQRDRRHELVNARQKWERDVRVMERKLGYSTDLEDLTLHRMVSSLDRLARRAVKLHDTSRAGLLIKARMALWFTEWQNIGKAMGKAERNDERMLWSIVRDLLDSGGFAPVDQKAFGFDRGVVRVGKRAAV